jgi:hypothetical protein
MSDRSNIYRDIFNGTNQKRWEEEQKQKNNKMKKFGDWVMKYGHWSFLASSLVEASSYHWFMAAAFMFLFINYQFLDKQ